MPHYTGEVLMADGRSHDATGEITRRYGEVLHNRTLEQQW